jgi:HAD superfamily hydrolase (TIGR01490 family)
MTHSCTSRVAAFFDLDNTLLPGEPSEVSFFRYLKARGLIGWREISLSLGWLLCHASSRSLQPLRERKLYLAGKRPAVIEPLAEEFCRAELIPRLSCMGVAKLDEHRRAGHQIVLVTGSLDFLIAPIASLLDVSMVLAASPERTPDGYTGWLHPPLPYGEGKRQLIADLAREAGIGLRESYAYGDSPGDVETLQTVGHPTVVNPIRGMARVARQHGWPVTKWK